MPTGPFKTALITALPDTARLLAARTSWSHAPLLGEPAIPRRLLRAFHLVSLARCRGSNTRLRRLAHRYERRLLEFLEDRQAGGEFPLPVLDHAAVDAREFQRDFVERRRPVVLRGFQSAAFRSWSTRRILEENRERRLPLTCNATARCEPRPLTDLGAPTPDGGRWYCENFGTLFDERPELLDDLETERLRPLLYPGGEPTGKCQLFIGLEPGRGTFLHCNSEFNVFHQVEGRKRWVLFDPACTPLLYPVFSRNTIYQLSAIGYPWSPEAQEHFPLLHYAPRYTIVLEPGDVLLNPPGWWHAIDVESAPNLSVARRWRCPWDRTEAGPLLSYVWKNVAPRPNPGAHDNAIRRHVHENVWRRA